MAASDNQHRPPVPDPVVDSLSALVDPAQLARDPAAVHIRAGALFARLKALNRAANGATRVQKQATADARQQMDHTYLSLQNLLYEKRHLEREIEKCRQFASVYQDVPVHSLEEFVELAPGEAKSQIVLSDDHQLMLNRLSFELAERQRLDQKYKELAKQKEELLKQSKAKLATMDSVKAQIDSLIKTATEVQKKVGELAEPLGTAESPMVVS
ncbi:Fms-interacting protein-domain-containing protein [Fomitopsis serialis]|uniref:Fms-interacting protein-domain-containing protein n=1 Tax=Fomitopsis serialis TaxID=139415 RepID=UPI0020076993|nr:Fms-interacting protein-domain-containing protein [Neoantrodia serialis]KAH9938620.1 Fms-interacting protein-domain-containing protein [Neoantrodia serialis]